MYHINHLGEGREAHAIEVGVVPNLRQNFSKVSALVYLLYKIHYMKYCREFVPEVDEHLLYKTHHTESIYYIKLTAWRTFENLCRKLMNIWVVRLFLPEVANETNPWHA